ncbi:MAG TPA: EamA family transporter RarD [Oligoflexus sp.]|uniref:EamA family transporter RarD n=1 Tax=Oligoflexus sp. TaxID=1971216 RepID=UPI002D4FCE15|nr:EamA family transporter RarD [Oligoflexus sp.]HYX32524.1 EamA family transporter RarD [Oligoflexus sp.]
MTEHTARTSLAGTIYALVAYVSWGITPIFWKQLLRFPAEAMLGFRVAWSCLILLALGLLYRGFVREQLQYLRSKKRVALILIATLLIAVNWFTYIWAVTQSRIVEASLGYYLNPLGNIVIGIFFFKERLSALRWAAFGLATVAVAILVLSHGELPWISLILACSFAFYGMVKKLLPLHAAFSLGLETLLMLPIAFFLIHRYYPGTQFVTDLSAGEHGLFFLSGIITLIPLFAFGIAARLLPYSTLGFFQYIAPTLQLFCAVILYHEPFDSTRMLSFGLIWISLLGLSVEQLVIYRNKRRSAAVH